MSVDRITVEWIAWGTEPPYHHLMKARLTYRQRYKMERLVNEESLSAATEYALRMHTPTPERPTP